MRLEPTNTKGAYIKYIGEGARGFYFRSPGDHRPKYFKAQ